MAEPNELSPAELEDPQIHEALQSEKIAGNLAAEARLTWQKAQEANSALCKDRGFGAVMSGGKGKSSNSSTGCFICRHPGHMARECPDRMSPKGKGKSKYNFGYTSSMWDLSYDNYVVATGKGKFKGSHNKGLNMMDHDAILSSKGKGKSFSKSPTTSSVNAYGIELYPLEFEHDHGHLPLVVPSHNFECHRWAINGFPGGIHFAAIQGHARQRRHGLSRAPSQRRAFVSVFAEGGSQSNHGAQSC